MRYTWTEVVENKKTIYCAFEKMGISLKTDGSEDGEKMHFQGQPVGVPEGLVYEAKSQVGLDETGNAGKKVTFFLYMSDFEATR